MEFECAPLSEFVHARFLYNSFRAFQCSGEAKEIWWTRADDRAELPAVLNDAGLSTFSKCVVLQTTDVVHKLTVLTERLERVCSGRAGGEEARINRSSPRV